MKRLMVLLGVFLLGMPLLRAQTEATAKKVAILEVVDRDNAINYGVKLLLRTTLAKAITQTQGYEGYDRVDIEAIQGEQDFQRTGMVSDEQIKRLGEMTGAAYVLVAEMAKMDESNFFVTAKILDVETAKLEKTEYVQMGSKPNQLCEACQQLAESLFGIKKQNDTIDRNPEKGKVVLYCEGIRLTPPRHLPIIVSIDGKLLGEGSVSEGFYFEIPNIREEEHKLKFKVKNDIVMGLGDRSSAIIIQPEEARFYEFRMKKKMLRSTEFFTVVLKNFH